MVRISNRVMHLPAFYHDTTHTTIPIYLNLKNRIEIYKGNARARNVERRWVDGDPMV